MAAVRGEVEAVSTKYGKFSVMVDGNWYGTKQEWAPDPLPNKGDTVQFDSGPTGKYLQRCKVVSAGGGAAPSGGGKPAGKAWSNLGVELGHASNIAKDMALKTDLEPGSEEWYKFWVTHTNKVYSVMSALRAKHEGGGATAKPKPIPSEDDEVVVMAEPKPEPVAPPPVAKSEEPDIAAELDDLF